jgi:hypothetical protein
MRQKPILAMRIELQCAQFKGLWATLRRNIRDLRQNDFFGSQTGQASSVGSSGVKDHAV